MAIAALYVERPPLTAAARLDIVGEDAVFCTPYHQPETALHQAVGAGVDRIVDVDLLCKHTPKTAAKFAQAARAT